MTSAVIVDGDMMAFESLFGNRTVILVSPPIIQGSGHATIGNKKVCIEGDEAKVQLNATYTTSSHTVPGTGIIRIKALDRSQLASECKSTAALITKGQQKFTAMFTPLVPAMTPPPSSTPDSSAPSDGKGEFTASQSWVKAGFPP